MNRKQEDNTELYHKSAVLKLKLLINGIRIDETAMDGVGTKYKEYQYGYNDSNWIRQERYVTIPSELVLPGGIVVAPHLRPLSPYLIKRVNGTLYVVDERSEQAISDISYLPRPKIWDLKLSDGSRLKKYLNVYGTNCLNLFIVANCDFWNEGKPCAFCSLQPTQNLHHEVIMYKSLNIIEEAIKLAFDNEQDLDWMIITGGSLKDRKAEIDRYCEVLNVIHKHIPERWKGVIKGNAALLPTNDEADLERLHATGIEHPSFNLEVWGKEHFAQYCPGKEKYVHFDTLLQTYKKAVKIWGSGDVWCNFVGGISPIEDLTTGFRYMADLGVVPGANIFHLDPKAMGVRLGLGEPSEEYVLKMYESLASIYKEYDYKPFFSEKVLRNSLSNEMYNGWL